MWKTSVYFLFVLCTSCLGQQLSTLSVDNPVRQSSTSNYNAFSIMMKASNGTIVDFYRKGSTHAGNDGFIVMQTSTDNGVTWIPFAGTAFCSGSTGTGCIFSDASFDSRPGAGGLAADGSLVFLYFKYDGGSGNSQGVFYTRSTDNGVTWSSPAQMAITGKTFGWTSNSATVVIPSGSSSPCASGCLGTVVWNVPQTILYLVLSTNNGQTWTTAIDMTEPAGSTNEVSLISTGPNALMGFGRNCQAHSIGAACNLFVISTTNLGSTWTWAASNLTVTNPPTALAFAQCAIAAGHACDNNSLISWELVSPWIIQSDSANNVYTVLFAERNSYTNGSFEYLRAVPFVPATAISSPTGFGYGQALVTTATLGSVNFGYEAAVQQQDALHNLIQYYNENEPSSTNVFVSTVNATYGCLGAFECSAGGLNLSGGMTTK